jgi:hypothetical protein
MLDEATRPRAPRQQPEQPVSPAGAQGQRTLLAIHGHLRDELDRVVGAVEAVAAGELSAVPRGPSSTTRRCCATTG